MSASTLPAKIELGPHTISKVQEVHVPSESSLAVQDADGRVTALSDEVQKVILDVLAALAERGEVTIARIPQHLTSTVAADLLGVSRPTLLRWSREGVIASFKVGSHTRFQRSDVVKLRDERERERRAAFDELRAMDIDEGDELFGA